MSRFFDENLPYELYGKKKGYERIEKPDDMHNNILEVLKRRVSFEWGFEHVRMGVNTEKKRHESSDIDLVYIFERVKPAKKLKLSRIEEDDQYTKGMMAILDPFSAEAKKRQREYKAFIKSIESIIPREYYCSFAHDCYNHNYRPKAKILYYHIILGDRKEAIDSLKFERNKIDEKIDALTKPFSLSA